MKRTLSTLVMFFCMGSLIAEPTPATGATGASVVTAPQRRLAGKVLLDEYLKQVRGSNQGYVASVKVHEGLKNRAVEGDAVYLPSFFANAIWANDQRQTNAPSFQGTKTLYDSYSLGVSKATSFGLQAKVSYNINFTNIVGATLLPVSKFYDARPLFEFTQSFWRNGFGKEIRSQALATEAQLLKGSFEASFRARQLLSEAEGAYWRLSLARATVDVRKQTLERAQTILDWAKRRVSNDLADKADLLQAEAAFEVRALELQAALDEEQSAARNYNSQLGVESDEVLAELEELSPALVDRIKVPQRAAVRDDVKAAEQDERLAQANTELVRERYAPTLDLVGALSLNGRNTTLSSSVDDSFSNRYPQTQVGVKFAMPLDFGLVTDARTAALTERQAAELSLQRKRFEQEREWVELERHFYQAKRRLDLALSIEELQRKKVFHEKSRLDKGRTTTFFTISMEAEYAAARLAKLQAAGEVLTVFSKLKTFGGEL